MIKKMLFTAAIVGTFAAGMLMSVNDSEAKRLEGTKGSSKTTEQTSECTSGLKMKCEGDGYLCNKTLGWDCIPSPN